MFSTKKKEKEPELIDIETVRKIIGALGKKKQSQNKNALKHLLKALWGIFLLIVLYSFLFWSETW